MELTGDYDGPREDWRDEERVNEDAASAPWGDGYEGVKGIIMKVGETLRHYKVMNNIKKWNDIIEKYSSYYNLDSKLVKAIIYEEQTHNKTPNSEWIPGGPESVGPMAVNSKHWGSYSRWDMMKAEINIQVGTRLLNKAIGRLNGNYSIGNAAAMYNSGAFKLSSLSSRSVLYGQRVGNFYTYF